MLTSDERTLACYDCGTITWWSLRDSCDSTVDAFLADPTRPLELTIQVDEQEFVTRYLAESLRAKVLAQCDGEA